MENLGGEIVFPTVEHICEVNRRMIESSGGSFSPPDNLNNPDALAYLLDSVPAELYGQNLYPTLEEKAAALAYGIIRGHPFRDGNKRTAIHTAWSFLRSNGVLLELDHSIVDLAVAIAEGTRPDTYEELVQWFFEHQGEEQS